MDPKKWFIVRRATIEGGVEFGENIGKIAMMLVIGMNIGYGVNFGENIEGE